MAPCGDRVSGLTGPDDQTVVDVSVIVTSSCHRVVTVSCLSGPDEQTVVDVSVIVTSS